MGAVLALACVPVPARAQSAVRKAPGPMTVEVPRAAAAEPTSASPGTPDRASGLPDRALAVPDRAAERERGALTVTVDRAKIIRLPERTQTVVIGNPAIADLAVQKNGIVVVTGKSYGVTNVIALDSGGNILAESIVSVNAPTDSIVTVQRGDQRQSYACTPSCQPSVQLGDSTVYFNDTKNQAEARSQFATSR